MISTLPPPPTWSAKRTSEASLARAEGRSRAPSSGRDEPVKYPSLQALLIAASHCARAKGGPVTPYANRIAGQVGFRVGDRVFILDRSGLDKALRDTRVTAVMQILSGDNGWLTVANLLAEGWRPPGTTER